MSYKSQYPKEAPELVGFKMPFAAGLDAGNELVRLADMIPWGEIEELCKDVFAVKGRKAYPVRVAVGAILLKEIRRVPGDPKKRKPKTEAAAAAQSLRRTKAN